MGFEKGNKLSPASQARAREEMEREYAAWAAREATVREFAQELTKTVGTLLACTPYAQWPHFAKLAFQHVEGKAPAAAQLYRERLPKENPLG